MNSIEITTALSNEDREAIISGVVERIRPLLDAHPEFVDAETMAIVLGVSTATLDRLRRAGQVPSTKLNNRRVYRPARVIPAVEAANETGASSE